jgi:BolA protein
MQQQITQQLRSQLNCQALEVINESQLHAGHNGFDGTGESHFRIIITSAELSQLPRVKAHQKIYAILAVQMQQIHALAIEITPTH